MDWIDCNCGNYHAEVKQLNNDVKNNENSLLTYIITA